MIIICLNNFSYHIFCKLTEKDIHISGDNISITLPHAKLLDINILPEDIKTVYQDVSFFRNNFTAQEKEELAAQAEKQIKGSADSLGILAPKFFKPS